MAERAKILFVDDEEAIRGLILTVLEGAGHEATGAGSVKEATEAFDKIAFDLVVIDKNLPDGSGIDLLRDLKRKRPDTEFMILTGYPSLESAIEALRAGAFDYMIKPVLDLDLVTQKVDRALERRRLLRQTSRPEAPAGGAPAAPAPLRRGLDDLAGRIAALRRALADGRADDAREIARAADDAVQALLRSLG
jgi:DNA-binding NtrC family response regulator